MRELSDEHRRTTLRIADAQPNDETGANEHVDVDGDRLDDDACEDNSTANQNGPLAANAVCEDRYQRQTGHLADGEDGVEEAKLCRRWMVEGVLPVAQCLETIHCFY